MNKGRRHELKMLHYKRKIKRLAAKSRSIKEYLKGNNTYCKLTSYRSHGKPCSCWCCSPPERKYNRAKERHELRLAHSAEFPQL
jgi:hypothetical protein